MTDRVSVEISGGVADVRLSRPEKLNALDPAMFAALAAAGERLKAEPGLRAAVLSGEGKAFCAGLDTGGLEQTLAEGRRLLDAARTAGGANPLQQAAMVWREVPVPVIAAVHGAAFGGGLQVALGCDLRFVAPDAKLSVMEIKWGLTPDMGGIALLRGLVRDDIARELIWSGRVVSGEEALGLGLATRLCADPRSEALAYARELAAKNPQAIRAGKRLVNHASDADLANILLEESREQGDLLGSRNQIEAVMANLETRPPSFSD